MIMPIPGNIIEFGCRYGQNLAALISYRSLLEPFNITRKVIGFDTFSGFPSIHEMDKQDFNKELQVNAYSTNCATYDKLLEEVLIDLSSLLNYSKEKSFDLVKGDALETVPKYFTDHRMPVSLAIFDFDLYEPTKIALETVWPFLSKGSILVFDQYGYDKWPGETRAVREFLRDKGEYTIKKLPFSQTSHYMVVE